MTKATKPRWEYTHTSKRIVSTGVKEASRPEPPPGDGWELVSAAFVGHTEIHYWWKRKVTKEEKGQ